jgi:regulator of replication initiation timing
MAKFLSKLIYSRVIAVSLLEKDKFPQVYFEGFFVCLQNYSKEFIHHKNQDIF